MNKISDVGSDDRAARLGLMDLTLVGCGATFGSGWLFAVSRVAAITGPDGPVVWVVGAIVALLIGLIYCELGAALPLSGGIVRYPYLSHGNFLGFMISIVTVISFSSVVSIEIVAARQYASAWMPFLGHADGSPSLFGWIVQILALGVIYKINAREEKSFALINNIVTGVKLCVPVLIICVLFKHFSVHPYQIGFPPGDRVGNIATALSAGGVMFSYLGISPIVAAAGDARRPNRDIPLALFLSIALVTGVYVTLQAIFIGALPAESYSSGWSNIQKWFPLPFHDIAMIIGAVWLATFVSCDACLSPLGTANVFMNATNKVVQACERGATERELTWIDEPGRAATIRALRISMGLCVFWMLPFPSWSRLINVVSAAVVMSLAFAPITVASLRRTAPGLVRPFMIPCLPIIGPLAFMLGSFVILTTGWTVVSWLLTSQLAIGAAYVIWRRWFSSIQFHEIGRYSWIMTYYGGMILFSWCDRTGAISMRLNTVSLACFASFLGGIYCWGSYSGCKQKLIVKNNMTNTAVVSLR